ncbi:MAG: P22 phage major capsid protein family protein, partial [Burkholderiales bacterium]
TTLVVPGAARAKLNQGLAPKDDNRCIQMDSVAMGSVVNGVAAYFNPTNAIGKQYTEGLVARTSMANWYENERILSVTNSSDVTGSTNASALVTDGGNTLAMFTDVVSPAEGSVFTVTGIFACHPETKAAYPHLQQYVVAVTSAGAAITISPRTFLTGPKKNVSSSTGADLTPTSFNSKVLTFVGAASTTYPQQLMYHKEAFQFVTGDLPIMDSAQKCVRKMEEKLSMRVWMDGDIRNDELLMRIDILHGFAALRPEWACRLIGAAAA